MFQKILEDKTLDIDGFMLLFFTIKSKLPGISRE